MKRWVVVALLAGCGSAASQTSSTTTPDAARESGQPSDTGAAGADAGAPEANPPLPEAGPDGPTDAATTLGADAREVGSDADAQDPDADPDAACPFPFPFLSETFVVTFSECTNGRPDMTLTETFGTLIDLPLPPDCLHRFDELSVTGCTLNRYRICGDTIINHITTQPDGTFVGTFDSDDGTTTCVIRGVPKSR